MPRKESPDRGAAAPGTFGRLLYDSRRKANKTIAAVAASSELASSYLTAIEQGRRSPTLGRVPGIAAAYALDRGAACWSWVVTFAPAAACWMARGDKFCDETYRQLLQDFMRDRDMKQKAEKEAQRSGKTAAREVQVPGLHKSEDRRGTKRK